MTKRPTLHLSNRAGLFRALFCASWVGWGGACTPEVPEEEPLPPVEFQERLGLAACDTENVEAHPDMRCHTFRAVAGVSMGGGTAARMGFNYPELFDVVGVLGTPFADTEFFWGMLENQHMSGFCSLEQLEAILAEDPEALNDPENPNVWCGIHDSYPLPESGPALRTLPAVPDSECWLFHSDFNHWYRGPDAGRGGSFTRNSLIEVIHDLTNAFGNPLTYNPDSNYFPPGVPETWHVPPGSDVSRSELCDNPIVLEGVYNREYNPDGTYPVITFCDGNSKRTGDYDPTDSQRHRNVVEFALAVDLNRNNRRDYGEPLLVNNRERYGDVGLDGLPNEEEPGFDADLNPDPNGDDWDPNTNPNGKERNFRYDAGEPYDDDGLDGIPATGDFGEGNGAYDLSPTMQRIFDRSPTRYFEKMPQSQVERVDVWIDAGIRDFLNTAQISNSLFATLKSRIPDSQVFEDFGNLPGAKPNGYVFYDPDYSRERMGQVSYLRYGDASVCPDSDANRGDGNHVGPDVVDRIYTLFSFLGARMPAQGRDRSIGGDISDLESPNGNIADFAYLSSFYSDVLGRDLEYGVLLPPDYYFSDRQDQAYPVLYFFHGQGMKAADLTAAGALFWGSMKESARADRVQAGTTDFQRAIIVWADGECIDDACWTGNFYADFEGLPRGNRQHESAVFELMRHVDANFRTKRPELLPR